MHPENAADPRLTGGGYVPYFYERGLFQTYAPPHNQRGNSSDSGPSLPYRLAPDVAGARQFADTQTVEQIVARGYFSVPEVEPTTAILTDKRQTSWLGLDDLIGQVRKRYRIYEQNLYQIQLGKCAATNSLYAHWAYHGLPDAKQFYSRHKRLQELYELEQDERTSLWKDVSRLRQTLPESALAYVGARRKVQALEELTGESP